MSSILRSTFGQNEARGYEKPYIGDTKTSAIQFDHYGWLVCDGRSLSKTEYSLLFNVIGYSFGGSGDTFQLPDPKGRVIGHTGSGSGLTTRTPGINVGAETETLDISEMPAHDHGGLTGASGEHTHGVTDPGHTHTYVIVSKDNGDFTNRDGQHPVGDAGVTQEPNHDTLTGKSFTNISIEASGNHAHVIQTQGGGNPFSNMQPTLFLGNMFIYSGKRHSGIVSNTAGRPIY
jgi:microcystin-dependent protein